MEKKEFCQNLIRFTRLGQFFKNKIEIQGVVQTNIYPILVFANLIILYSKRGYTEESVTNII